MSDPAPSRAPLIRAHRLYSITVLETEQFNDVFKLRPYGKEYDASRVDLDLWTNIDTLPDHGISCRLEIRGNVTITDLDIDARFPNHPSGEPWTPAMQDQARRAIELAYRALVGFLPSNAIRYSYGRESMGFKGHLVLPVATPSKAAVNRLNALHSETRLPMGDMTLHIEVRRPNRTRASQLTWTLPGSYYRNKVTREPDLVGWTILPDVTEGVQLTPLEPVSVSALALAMYAAVLGLAVEQAWDGGKRNTLALAIAGVLRKEVEAGEITPMLAFMDAEQAKEVFGFVIGEVEEGASQREFWLVYDKTFRKTAEEVNGYAQLSDLTCPEARTLLLRFRGGGDPDSLTELFDSVVYVEQSCTQNGDSYVNLASKLEVSQAVLVRQFHPKLRPMRLPDGKEIPLIRIAINSPKLRRVSETLYLPGIDFGEVFVGHGEALRPLEENEVPEEGSWTVMNVAKGYVTRPADEPRQEAWDAFHRAWHGLLSRLTSGDKATITRIEKAIAFCVQFPLEKIPLGILFTGGHGIGKDSFASRILRPILGDHLIMQTTQDQIENDSNFAWDRLNQVKLLVISEMELRTADIKFKSMLKNLMRADRWSVNVKYGRKTYGRVTALPIFTSNEVSPSFLVDGVPDRALLIVRGETPMSKGMTQAEWTAYRQNTIDPSLNAFEALLKQPEVREAAMAYFDRMEVARSDFDLVSESINPEDIRASIDPLHESFIDVLEGGSFVHKQENTNQIVRFPLNGAFTNDLLIETMEERMRQRGGRRWVVTPQRLTQIMKELFGRNLRQERLFRAENAGVVKKYRAYYFDKKIGTLIEELTRLRGIPITPSWVLDPEKDYGDNVEPTERQCRAVFGLSTNDPPPDKA